MGAIANPVQVHAKKITRIGPVVDGGRFLTLFTGEQVFATIKHINNFNPSAGDYWVTASEGDPYIIAKATFQTNYPIGFK